MKALNRTLAVIIAVFGIVVLAGCPDNPGAPPGSTWTDVDNDGFDDNTHKHENGTFYDDDGYDWEGYDKYGYDRDGWSKPDANGEQWDKDDKNRITTKIHDEDGYDRTGWSEPDANGEQWNRQDENKTEGGLWDKDDYNRAGWSKPDANGEQWNRQNINKTTKIEYDSEGYDRNGLDKGGWAKIDIKTTFGLNNAEIRNISDSRLPMSQYLDTNMGRLGLKADALKKIFANENFNAIQGKTTDDNTAELIDRVKQACDENNLGGVQTKTHADDVVTTGVKAISTYIVSMLARMDNGIKDKDFDMTFAERLEKFRLDAYNTFAGISTDMTPVQRAELFDGLKYDLADAFAIHPEIMQYLLYQIKNVEEYFGMRDKVYSQNISDLALPDHRNEGFLIKTRPFYDFAAVMASVTSSTLEPYNP